jgi:5S rRNA maturation endonuclease (ribonuclease M5)
MNAAEFISRLGPEARPSKTSTGWTARCPAHDDRRASLSVTEAGDKLLIHCHAGCRIEDICAAVGLSVKDLFLDAHRDGNAGGKPRIIATYDYHDESGNLLFQVVRFEPKDFRQRAPDGKGGWTWRTAGVRKVLYRLPEVIAAVKAGTPVLIPEGEKDANALAGLGFCATCNAGGASRPGDRKWLPEFADVLRGANVFILPDKDEPGRRHAQNVAQSLFGQAARIAIVELPDRDGKPVKDASDWLSAGGDAAELSALLDAAPEWRLPENKVVELTPVGGDAADVRKLIVAALTDKNATARDQRQTIANGVVDALEKRGRFFYDADLRSFATAMYFDGQRKCLLRIQSDAFLAWLADWTGINRAENLFAFVAAGIETAALTETRSTGISPVAYWAQREGRIYISNGDAALCRITPGQVEMLPNGSDDVLFPAGRTLPPWKLTDAADPFVTCSLFNSIQADASNAIDLVKLWTFSLPTCPRSKPPLCLFGAIGAGKTRLALGIAEFYGLPATAAKVEDRLEGDFWPAVHAGGLFILDNADTRTKWLPDALANASTAGAVARRRLYTDGDLVTLRANAWIAVTTAHASFAADPGLADRLMVVRLRRREGTTSDEALSAQIAKNRDAGLSFVAQTLARGLADTAPTPALNARHPDFASFAIRIARALDIESQGVAALSAAERDKSMFCLQNDTLGAALLAHVTGAVVVEGDAGAVRTILAQHDNTIGDWSNKSVGRRLMALWPHIESVFKAKKIERQGYKVFTISARP